MEADADSASCNIAIRFLACPEAPINSQTAVTPDNETLTPRYQSVQKFYTSLLLSRRRGVVGVAVSTVVVGRAVVIAVVVASVAVGVCTKEKSVIVRKANRRCIRLSARKHHLQWYELPLLLLVPPGVDQVLPWLLVPVDFGMVLDFLFCERKGGSIKVC
jgi:hypothetical protein